MCVASIWGRAVGTMTNANNTTMSRPVIRFNISLLNSLGAHETQRARGCPRRSNREVCVERRDAIFSFDGNLEKAAAPGNPPVCAEDRLPPLQCQAFLRSQILLVPASCPSPDPFPSLKPGAHPRVYEGGCFDVDVSATETRPCVPSKAMTTSNFRSSITAPKAVPDL